MKRNRSTRVQKKPKPSVSLWNRLRELIVSVRFLVIAYDALHGLLHL
jgi:hypothetical protein